MDSSMVENSIIAMPSTTIATGVVSTVANSLAAMTNSDTNASSTGEENNSSSFSSVVGYERKLSSDCDDKDTSVRVAVRIRPQIPREIIDMCRICTTVTPGEPQVVLGGDKAFTFDYVFDINSAQKDIYAKCVEKLVDGSLKGYNATVLAYGQTGSGKTYTMGTGFDCEISDIQEGIIPRAVRHIFAGIESMQNGCIASVAGENGSSDGIIRGSIQFSVAAQFMELYNEEIIDLLDPYNKGRVFKIHEDPAGGIYVSGGTITPIHGPQDALKCLQQGALARTTASTQMNAQSSRSHALFTILIRRQRVLTAEECGLPEGDLETLTSKFHFVDLAGSERLKRTGATGERAREGISINCGLLALGNVISALGDKSKRATHVPYRDSKLTRLLQDSLGGNSQTLMIACVSPSDRDFMETLNTLKYANRARNIKNKVLLNQDQSSRTIMQLRREIAALQMELLEYKQGKRSFDAEGNAAVADTFQENAMLLADNKRLQQRLKAMQETINTITEKNADLMLQKVSMNWSATDTEKSVTDVIGGYIVEIEKLQAKLLESEQMYQQLKKSMNSPRNNFRMNNIFESPESVINMAKVELEKERELLMSRSLPGYNEDSSNSNVENNDSESDSDTESDDKTGQIQAELIDISSDIELKSKLIEQLELSQQRMQVMRQHYEEKLHVLNTKIVNTQKERDQVLANMGSAPHSSQSTEKVKKVRDEYERKISDLHRELRKLQSAQKEHVRLQRELQSHESQLKTLRNELSDLKAMKTRLMRKMQDESNRHKEEEGRKVREIAQLRKESRKQLNAIKSLQAQGAAKDQVLKRRTEEVSALRRSQKGMLSLKAQGRIQPKKAAIFSPRHARMKWENLQRTIGRTAESKKTIVQLESELERLIHDRETLSRGLANVRNKLRQHETPELISEEDTLKANLNYVQEVMTQIQHSIIDIEEGKESANSSQLQTLIENVQSVEEARYLLEKLATITVAQTCDNTLAQTKLSENEARIKEFRDESDILQQLMQHILAQNPALTFSDLSQNFEYSKQRCSESWSTIDSNSTFDIPSDMPSILNDHQRAICGVGGGGGSGSGTGPNSNHMNQQNSRSSRSPSPAPTIDLDYTSKVRRRTAQPQDLLFGDAENHVERNDAMTRSYTQHETAARSFIPLARVPSAPGSLKQALNNTASPSLNRKPIDATGNLGAPLSPRVSRRPFPNKGSPGLDEDVTTPIHSPPVYRRMTSREDAIADVFSRLGAGTQDPSPGGNIQKYTGKTRAGVPLFCTHTVVGHNNSVLSIKVHDNILFTAAADRTVKVWDLEQDTSQHCLATHPGPVIAVEYDRKTNLLFSASGPYVRVWDLRSSNIRAVKTLCSSGQLLTGNSNLGVGQSGESSITALCMGSSGNLYVAASDKVRIWDLKNLSCLGKLSGGHQAAVMCCTAWEGSASTDFVATGSKDHYVKVFEVPSTGGVVYPLLNLEPPHYDGVQALAVAQDALGADAELFSGSRDSGIKRWDLRNGELKQSLNNAHKGWVSGMAISGDVLLSSCRGGIIRLWNVKTCDSLAEMKTDSSINDIVASGQRVFTASSTGKVRIWRFKSSLKRQYSLEDS